MVQFDVSIALAGAVSHVQYVSQRGAALYNYGRAFFARGLIYREKITQLRAVFDAFKESTECSTIFYSLSGSLGTGPKTIMSKN